MISKGTDDLYVCCREVRIGMRIELEVKAEVSKGGMGRLAKCPLSRLEVVQVTCREWGPATPSKVLLAVEG